MKMEGGDKETDAAEKHEEVPRNVPRRVLKTVALYCCFLALGMASTVHHPTLINLEILLRTDIASLGASFIGGTFGYLVGSAVGGVVMDKVNREFMFATCGLLSGLLTIAQPWPLSVVGFGTLNALKAIFMGAIDAGGQSYILGLWTSTRYKDPTMQALHCIWSLGSLLGPVVVTPFLVELSDGGINNVTAPSNWTDSKLCLNLSSGCHYESANESASDLNITSQLEPDVTLVRYGYMAVGCMVCVGSLVFYFICLYEGPSLKFKKPPVLAKKATNVIKTYPQFKLFLIVLLCAFFISYAYMEDIIGTYGATFVVKQYGWSVQQGALVTSLYWGSLGVGRFFAIPISTVVSPGAMLICCSFACLLNLFVLALVSHIHDAVIWVCIAVHGLSLASIFPSAMLWASQNITVTGKTAGAFVVASSLGGMSAIYVAGFLFQNVSYMWMLYLPTLGNIANALLIIVLFIASALWWRQHSDIKDEHSTEMKELKNENT